MIGFTSINVLAGVCLETNQNNPIQTKQNQYKNFKTNHSRSISYAMTKIPISSVDTFDISEKVRQKL